MQEVLAQAKRLISEVVAQADYEVQRILLFGSRARGEALPDSDWDFFVITDCEPPPEGKQVIQMELIPNFQQRVSTWEERHWRPAPPKKKVYPGKWYQSHGYQVQRNKCGASFLFSLAKGGGGADYSFTNRAALWPPMRRRYRPDGQVWTES